MQFVSYLIYLVLKVGDQVPVVGIYQFGSLVLGRSGAEVAGREFADQALAPEYEPGPVVAGDIVALGAYLGQGGFEEFRGPGLYREEGPVVSVLAEVEGSPVEAAQIADQGIGADHTQFDHVLLGSQCKREEKGQQCCQKVLLHSFSSSIWDNRAFT